MTETDPRNTETVHVFTVDLPPEEARALAADGALLSDALGGIEVEPDRAEIVDPEALAEIGMAAYLAEGEGVSAEALDGDRARLDALAGPVLILRPRAVSRTISVRKPLTLIGSYPLERARPAGEAIRSTSAEPLATGAPPAEDPTGRRDKRASGVVAMVALAVALFVAFIVWLVAA